LGYEDETWWSRFEQPSLHSWAEAGEPMRLLRKEAKKDDPDPKALSCYGLYLPGLGRSTWLRFADGRTVSAITTQFLEWVCQKLERLGKKALLLVWDNASWHKSKFVKEWIVTHNREVKQRGSGVRIVPCFLPKKSPWLNAIEPKWVHGKRKVVEPGVVLTAHELGDRVCEVFGCTHEPHLSISQEVA
jgi:transposase